MKTYEEKFNSVDLPNPNAVADVIADEILAAVGSGEILNRKTLAQAVINGFLKTELVYEAEAQDLKLSVVRDEILDEVEKAFRSDGQPGDVDIFNLYPATMGAIRRVCNYYIAKGA